MSLVYTDELVLQVKPDVDPNIFDIDKYDDFLDILCGSRDYLRESIHESVRFLLGGEYQNTLQLAKENYESNSNLQEYFGSFHNFEERPHYLQSFAHLER